MSQNQAVCDMLTPIIDPEEPKMSGDDCLESTPVNEYFPSNYFGSSVPLDKSIKFIGKPKEILTFALIGLIILVSFALILFICH